MVVASWRIRILATDFSDAVLAQARAGTYSDLEIARGLPPGLKQKYFRALQGRWSISQECRRLVEFRQLNLIGIYGKPSDRRALVRLPNGRFQKVQVGDRIDGGRISAIGDEELRYQKGSRNIVLKMPKG